MVREWLAAGHPFRERCIKLGTSNMRYKGQAPTFLMFLDAVYQVSATYVTCMCIVSKRCSYLGDVSLLERRLY